MTRISENQVSRSILNAITNNRKSVDKYSQELSTGLKVADPGDSTFSGTISQLRGVLERIEGYDARVKTVDSSLAFQESVLAQAGDQLVRAKEIAAQGVNESNSETERFALSEELLNIRDHLVSLANSNYQGIYIFHGAATDTPPFLTDTYATGDAGAAVRYVYDDRSPQADGHDLTRDVRVTDNLTVTVNTPGDEIFEDAIITLETLARSLRGFQTDSPPTAIGVPGTGAAYTSAQFAQQSIDIRAQIDALDVAREEQIQPERVNVAARQNRLETAANLLELSKISTKEVLSKLQDADPVDAATNFSIAQTALEASMAVTGKVLNMSILDYL